MSKNNISGTLHKVAQLHSAYSNFEAFTFHIKNPKRCINILNAMFKIIKKN